VQLVPEAAYLYIMQKKLNCKFVEGTDKKYRVCDNGIVISLMQKKARILRHEVRSDGYLQVSISFKKDVKMKSLHRLVAEAFIENNENKETVNHKDGDKTNNCVSNLEWNTRSENIQHSVHVLKNQHGKRKKQ
jgi:hypothetical protein